MPEEEAEEPDAEDGEEEEDEGIQPGEVDEINEDSIKQLAAAAAGGEDSGDDDADDDDDEMEMEEPSGGGSADIKIEKLKSSIDMLKEQNSSTTDRLQTLSQTLGEIRQMVHEQETKFNNLEVDVDKMKDQMEDLDPQKLSKQMQELESGIDANEAAIQKLENKLDRVAQTANDTQDTLKRLGSMDNLLELNKEFEEKLDEIKEAERYIERLAAKSEKINIQINKKLTEYSTYKARVDALQEKADDMYKKLDETSIEVKDAVKEEKLEEIRERIKEMEDELEEYSKIAPLAEMSLPEPIADLREQRRDIESFLDELEKKRERGDIEESEYERIKQANEEKLDDIRKQLIQEWKDLEDVDEDAAGGGGGSDEGGGPNEPDESGGSGGSSAESGEDADAGENADEDTGETAADDYGALVDQSITEVQAEVREMNLDIDKVIEAEENGENRDTLIEWLEDKQGEDEEEESFDYEEIAGQPADDVKKAVKNKDLDLTELLNAERNNQNRNELLEWIENKLAGG